MEIGNEISQKIKTAIKSKLVDFGSYVDDELPDYIMVMVANKRSQSQMAEDLNLFLGENSLVFCDWLHDLLQKLQEVTEGAFEVKVPIREKPKTTEAKTESKTNDSDREPLKISRKPSPIRMPDTIDAEQSSDNQSEGMLKRSSHRKNKNSIKKNENNSAVLQSAVVVQKRPTLPPSKQANPALLKKAMKAAQVSVEDVDQGEYNPEVPASSDLPKILSQNPEGKRRQKERLLEEHKKLQRLKSQQDESEESKEPVIELQVTEDDDLFRTEEVVRDRRIVVEKDAESDSVSEINKKETSRNPIKRGKKSEKRKIDEDETNESREQTQSASSGSEGESQKKDKERRVKTKEKRRKPKFIVTLEGVGGEYEKKYEKKYEKEHSRRKRRRKGSDREQEQDKPPVINTDVPLLPVFPQLIQAVHQVPGVVPPQLNSVAPPVQVMPPMIMPPVPVATQQHTVTQNVERENEEMVLSQKEKCRFWPQCKNGNDCPFYHPDVTCKHFPNCRYGKDCSYVHPPCKFGSRCTSTSCPYSHLATTGSVSAENQILCRYHPFCTKRDCPFLHPTDKPCRYGNSCSRPDCSFNHSTPPPREQLKWVAPKVHVSDRQFAVKESSTTPLPVQ